MSINPDALIVPGHGTLFVADKNTLLPDDVLNAFTLTGPAPEGWENLGHTSKDNPPAYARDGGEPTKLDSWLVDGVTTIYSATNWALTFSSIQVDANSMDLSFGGAIDPADGSYIIPNSTSGIDKALFLLSTDGTGKLGFYQPNTSVALGDAPGITTDGFFELPMSASIQAADEDVIPAVNGKPGIIKVFKTGLVPALPKIASVLPTTPAPIEGTQIRIAGSGFTGVTALKVGSATVPATDYVVASSELIVAKMPAGSAGSAPVKVTNDAGDSPAFAFTRGA